MTSASGASRASWVGVLTCVLVAPLAMSAAQKKKGSPHPTPTPTPTASPTAGLSGSSSKRKLSGGLAAPGAPEASSGSATPGPLGGEGGSIADAARRSREAKESRERKPQSLGVITNETLKRGSSSSVAGTASSSRGTLSVAPARPGERQPAPLPTVGPATDLEGRTEKEWKERVSILKSKSSASEAEVKRLEEEARRLENDFFAWSDGSYRDGVIKPAWEKAKADLRTARENLDAAALEVSDLEEEARKSGAPPGWLR